MSTPDPITATDIITYIGVPLAVIGVLPILYTFVLSIITQRRIRHLLVSHGHKPHTARNVSREEGFMLRASPMTSLIEVEMPRYTIAPVERSDEQYWEVSGEALGRWGGDSERSGLLRGHGRSHSRGHVEGQGVDRVESTLSMVEEGRVRGFLRGGSWRTFNWRRLVVGRKLYRIQYEDELREPPAEIEFSELVHFLMDWGAELDGMGWEKLRSGGLWTPSGTVLLKVSDEVEEPEMETKLGGRGPGSRNGANGNSSGDWVLRTSMPDDSDGILTLCIRWPPGRSYRSIRDSSSLPPGWGRIRRPATSDSDDQSSASSSISTSKPAQSSKFPSLVDTIISQIDTNKTLLSTSTIRLSLDASLITKAYVESAHGSLIFEALSLHRMSHYTQAHPFFTTSVSSLLNLNKTSGHLWGYTTPAQITAFVRKDSIPCGVMVVLSLLSPHDAPHWHQEEDSEDRILAINHSKRFQARLQAERLEAAMPPDQARVHRMNREMDERRAQADATMDHLAKKRAREHKRLQDAIVSPRLGCHVVASTCLAWLIQQRIVPDSSTVCSVAESVLFLLVVQSQIARAAESHPCFEGAGDDKQNSAGKRRTEEEETMPVMKVMEEWLGWSVAGGMKREHVEMLERYKIEFCFAACLVGVVCEAAGAEQGLGKASVDMLECLAMWRKVRLG